MLIRSFICANRVQIWSIRIYDAVLAALGVFSSIFFEVIIIFKRGSSLVDTNPGAGVAAPIPCSTEAIFL